MNRASLVQVLLTAFPQSLQELGATNMPAVSRILWSDFLDDNTPSWFSALPTDIQSYLKQQYGPPTASVSCPTLLCFESGIGAR